MIKEATILLHKDQLYLDIDSMTYKRTDAALDQSSDRTQNAVSSDAVEGLDHNILSRYCDLRDALMRKKLKFCLMTPPPEKPTSEEETEERTEFIYSNLPDSHPTYEYHLKLSDDMTEHDIQSIGTKMHNYIVRGALFDWYLGVGLNPSDTQASLDALLDDLVGDLRGQAWGHRPMQPFGPAFYNYYKKNY